LYAIITPHISKKKQVFDEPVILNKMSRVQPKGVCHAIQRPEHR
jgi:hypothetical protein